MVFHWSLSDSKSPQVCRTRLRILAVLSNTVVWIVSTCPPTSKSSRPFNNPLVIVPNTPITIGTIVTFMFHSFFNSLARSKYLSFFSLSFRFILWSAGTAKSTILQILFLFVDYYEVWSSGRDHHHHYYYYYYYYNTPFELMLWSFTGVWVTVNLLSSLGLFWVFLTMLYFGWFLFIIIMPKKKWQDYLCMNLHFCQGP